MQEVQVIRHEHACVLAERDLASQEQETELASLRQDLEHRRVEAAAALSQLAVAQEALIKQESRGCQLRADLDVAESALQELQASLSESLADAETLAAESASLKDVSASSQAEVERLKAALSAKEQGHGRLPGVLAAGVSGCGALDCFVLLRAPVCSPSPVPLLYHAASLTFFCISSGHFAALAQEVLKLSSSLESTALDLHRKTGEHNDLQSMLSIKEAEVEALREGKFWSILCFLEGSRLHRDSMMSRCD